MNAFRASFLVFAFTVVASRADETNLTLTVDGVSYSNVTFGTVTPSGVNIRHSTGIARLPLAKLPADLQQRFGHDPQKAAEMQKLEQRKAEIQKLQSTPLTDPFKVGMVGVAFNGKIKVIQVAGPKDMYACITIQRGKPEGYTMDGKLTRSTTEMTEDCVLVWIAGLSTAGVIDDTEITRHNVFKITGTKTYDTVGVGMKTIFLLEPLTPN